MGKPSATEPPEAMAKSYRYRYLLVLLLVLLVLLSLLLLLVLLAVPIVLRFYPIHRYRYLRATTRPWGQSHRRTTTKSGPQQKVTISWPSTSCCAFSCRILPSHGLAHLTAELKLYGSIHWIFFSYWIRVTFFAWIPAVPIFPPWLTWVHLSHLSHLSTPESPESPESTNQKCIQQTISFSFCLIPPIISQCKTTGKA